MPIAINSPFMAISNVAATVDDVTIPGFESGLPSASAPVTGWPPTFCYRVPSSQQLGCNRA